MTSPNSPEFDWRSASPEMLAWLTDRQADAFSGALGAWTRVVSVTFQPLDRVEIRRALRRVAVDVTSAYAHLRAQERQGATQDKVFAPATVMFSLSATGLDRCGMGSARMLPKDAGADAAGAMPPRPQPDALLTVTDTLRERVEDVSDAVLQQLPAEEADTQGYWVREAASANRNRAQPVIPPSPPQKRDDLRAWGVLDLSETTPAIGLSFSAAWRMRPIYERRSGSAGRRIMCDRQCAGALSCGRRIRELQAAWAGRVETIGCFYTPRLSWLKAL